jgi:hypothetical protein
MRLSSRDIEDNPIPPPVRFNFLHGYFVLLFFCVKYANVCTNVSLTIKNQAVEYPFFRSYREWNEVCQEHQ